FSVFSAAAGVSFVSVSDSLLPHAARPNTTNRLSSNTVILLFNQTLSNHYIFNLPIIQKEDFNFNHEFQEIKKQEFYTMSYCLYPVMELDSCKKTCHVDSEK